jgi:hypothetical protein
VLIVDNIFRISVFYRAEGLAKAGRISLCPAP